MLGCTNNVIVVLIDAGVCEPGVCPVTMYFYVQNLIKRVHGP